MKIIVFVGRLDEDTGIMEYLEAFRLLSGYKLTICGDGVLRGKAEAFVKKYKLNAEFAGAVAEPEKYLANARYVFASGYLSALEAMAGRKLVFAIYNNPLKKDYWQMTPFAKWIVVADNPRELYKKILHYEKHPKEEKALTDNAYAWAKEQSWERLADLYYQIYTTIVV